MRRRANVPFGVLLGVFMAAAASVAAVAARLLRGAELFDRLGTTLGETVLLYGAGGILGGAVGGALLPLATWRIGAAVVGVLAAMPVFIANALAGDMPLDAAIVPGSIVGALVGYAVWTPVRPNTASSDCAAVDDDVATGDKGSSV